MRKVLAGIFLAVGMALMPAPALVPTAGAVDILQPACNQAQTGNTPSICSDNKTNDPGNPITGLLKIVINVLSFVGGAIAVVMIIVSGLRFTISGGDSASIAAARRSIIFAIVGLVIVAVAQFVIPFVVTRI